MKKLGADHVLAKTILIENQEIQRQKREREQLGIALAVVVKYIQLGLNTRLKRLFADRVSEKVKGVPVGRVGRD